MTELIPGRLYVGDVSDYEYVAKPEAEQWYVVHACKEPYHRKELGYTGRAAPKEHPEYLICRRERRLILNLIDPPSMQYIPHLIMEAAVLAVHQGLQDGLKVLVHCNEGKSRAPSIAFLFMAAFGYIPVEIRDDHDRARTWFKTVCPEFAPGEGMSQYLAANYDRFRKLSQENAGDRNA